MSRSLSPSSKTRSRTPIKHQKRSSRSSRSNLPYYDHRTPRELLPILDRDNAERPKVLNNPKHVSVPERRCSRLRSRPLGVPKYILERHSKSRSRSRSRSTLPTLDRIPKKGVDTTQNLDTGLNINQNFEGSERSMHRHDGNSSPPCNKSVRAKRHSRSRTRSKTPMNGQKKSTYHDHRTPREMIPIMHCDNAKTPETLDNPKHLSVPAKRHSRLRSKSRSRS